MQPPAQKQLHDVARSRPMTATATQMVKTVWQAYFIVPGGAKPGAEAGEEGEKAKVRGARERQGEGRASHGAGVALRALWHAANALCWG